MHGGRSRTNGVLVFRGFFHLDDETQVAFSQRFDDVGKVEPAALPKISNVTLDPTKSSTAAYLRGTVDWHIDGAQDDVPSKATTLGAHVISSTGGETEFASTYAAYDDLTDAEKAELYEDLRVAAFPRGLAASRLPGPHARAAGGVALEALQGTPVLLRQHRSGPTLPGHRGLGFPRGRLGTWAEGTRRCSPTCSSVPLPPERVDRHEWSVGDLVHLGQHRRHAPGAGPMTPPRVGVCTHRTTMSGDEPIR